MPSPSPFARRSSISAPRVGDREPRPRLPARRLAARSALAFALTVPTYLAARRLLPEPFAAAVAGVTVAAAVGVFGALAARRGDARLVRAQRWQRKLSGELASRSAFLDGLVAALEAVSGTLDETRVLARATAEAHRLFGAEATLLLAPATAARALRPVAAEGVGLGPIADLSVALDEPGSLLAEVARTRRPAATGVAGAGGDELVRRLRPTSALAVPLVVRGELEAMLVLLDLHGGRPFGADDLAQVTLFADFVARSAENATLFARVEALLGQARVREAERAVLSRRVLSAEQDERHRLSLYLHDGPVQSMSGIAMMLDAVEDALARDDAAGATGILATARERQRGVIRSLRELSFALEPWVLRDQGFVTAVKALGDELERGHTVRVALDVEAAERLEDEQQVLLYQIVREAMRNAVKHADPSLVTVAVHERADGAVEASVADDGCGMTRERPDDGLPHHGLASMRERAAILGAELDLSSQPGHGTTVRVGIPAAGGERRDAA